MMPWNPYNRCWKSFQKCIKLKSHVTWLYGDKKPIEERACHKTRLGGGDYSFRTSALPPPLKGRHSWWGRKNGVVCLPSFLAQYTCAQTHAYISKISLFMCLNSALVPWNQVYQAPPGPREMLYRLYATSPLLHFWPTYFPTYCNIGPSPAVNFCIIRGSIVAAVKPHASR